MTRVIFIHPDNRSEQVEAENDASVMVAALTHGIDGTVAECGGNAVCATCHVYVDEAWLGKLDSIDAPGRVAGRHRVGAPAEQPAVLPDQGHACARWVGGAAA